MEDQGSKPTGTAQTTPAPTASVAPQPQPKKSKTAAQLAALAKGREIRRQNREGRSVVRNNDSADELLERVKHQNPEAEVKRGKRKRYDGYDSASERSSSSSGNGKYYVGAALLGGLALVGVNQCQKGALGSWLPISAPPPKPSARSEASNPSGPSGPSGTQPLTPVTVSLSSSDY